MTDSLASLRELITEVVDDIENNAGDADPERAVRVLREAISRLEAAEAVVETARALVSSGHTTDADGLLIQPDDDVAVSGRAFDAAADALVALDSLQSPAKDALDDLADAVREVNRDHPLPRCPHGSALRDHAGDLLEPPCGCRSQSPAK